MDAECFGEIVLSASSRRCQVEIRRGEAVANGGCEGLDG